MGAPAMDPQTDLLKHLTGNNGFMGIGDDDPLFSGHGAFFRAAHSHPLYFSIHGIPHIPLIFQDSGNRGSAPDPFPVHRVTGETLSSLPAQGQWSRDTFCV